MARFAKRMKEERLTLGMSQEKLAKISGVSQQAISMIEAEKRSPTEETMEMIAGGLDWSDAQILEQLLHPFEGPGHLIAFRHRSSSQRYVFRCSSVGFADQIRIP